MRYENLDKMESRRAGPPGVKFGSAPIGAAHPRKSRPRVRREERSERTESVCRMQSDETDARPCNSNRRAILNPEKS